MGRRYNCTCLFQGNDGALKDTFTWPTVSQTVASLKASSKQVASKNIEGPPTWLGAIISGSMTSVRFKTASSSVSSAGFAVRWVRAAMPGHFGSKQEMIQDLFGVQAHLPMMIGMTAFEIALLISHKRALRAIALSKFAWGAVFEDDAYLHEAVPPWRARHLIRTSISAAEAAHRRHLPILYLGSCKPRCEADVVNRSDQQALANGLTEGMLRVGRCYAFCTHAYALSRPRAATFFADVFGCRNETTGYTAIKSVDAQAWLGQFPGRLDKGPSAAGCGSECELWPCFADWSMVRFFQRSSEAWIVGGGLVSRWSDNHRGLFIQNRSAAHQGGSKIKRSGLAKPFRWGGNGSSALLEEQGCEQELNTDAPDEAAIRPRTLKKLLVTVRWSGRVGNLMFEAAMLAAVVKRLRQIVADTEAVTFGLPSTPTVPVKELFEQFPLHELVRLDRASTSESGRTVFDEIYEKQLAGCEACKLVAQEHFANRCDYDLIRRLGAWATSPPHGCRTGLIELQGFYQCVGYFDGAVGELLRSTLFASTAPAQREADALLASVRRQLPHADVAAWKLVGVQVRLGDKVQGKYAELYAATSWGYYRTAMLELGAMLRQRGAAGVAFIVTAGGTMGSNAVDVASAQQNLTINNHGQRLFFSTASSPYVDLAVLRICDALVIGGSSFGWWAAYLARLPRSYVIAPRHIISPKLPRNHFLVRGYRKGDYYPPEWRLIDNDGQLRPGRDSFATPSPLPPPPPPPPPRPAKVSPSPCSAPSASRRCFLRIVGSCPNYARPQYRSWWATGALASTPTACAQRQRVWQASCGKKAAGHVQMQFCP